MSNSAERREYLLHRASEIRFPEGFLLGSATAAFQIEGAAAVEGKGESIQDKFTRKRGAIAEGANGNVACDHHRLWQQDIGLMRDLGLGAYRFSLSWARVQPTGAGKVNKPGVAFYDRLIDGLLEAEIEPFLTLYHWDLPQALQEKGGWYNRDTAKRFADYAATMAGAFGDRVTKWITLSDPFAFCWSGHALGEEAPGLADGVKGGVTASHHALLAHGLAVPLIRSEARQAEVGIALDLTPVEPATERDEDRQAAMRFDGAHNRWSLDALFKGSYPEDMLDLYGRKRLPPIETEDLRAIAAPIDFLGITSSGRAIIKDGPELSPLSFERVSPRGSTYTPFGLEIWPQAIADILEQINETYKPNAIYVTANGMATVPEAPDARGHIDDMERADYLVSHIEKLASAVEKGVPVKGYFAWSLLDGFDWSRGYTAPTGIIHVDFARQERRVKWSGEVYAGIAREAPGR